MKLRTPVLTLALLAPLLTIGVQSVEAAPTSPATVTATLADDDETIIFSSSITGSVGDTFTVINNTGLIIFPMDSGPGTVTVQEGDDPAPCDESQATCLVIDGLDNEFIILTVGSIDFVSDDGVASGILNFGSGRATRPPYRTVVLDPTGGTCGAHSTTWTLKQRGAVSLPTADECTLNGKELLGWTTDQTITSPDKLLSGSTSTSGTLFAVWGVPALTVTKGDGWVYRVKNSPSTLADFLTPIGDLWCGDKLLTFETKCSIPITSDETVTLAVFPKSPNIFGKFGETFYGSWGGACAETTESTCVLTLGKSATVSVDYDTLDLSVTTTGSGSGKVIDIQPEIIPGLGLRLPSLISCGEDCSETYPTLGTKVSLSAAADAGSYLESWGGACSGTPATSQCSLTMDDGKTVTAEFKRGNRVVVQNNAQRIQLIWSLPTTPNSPFIMCGKFFGFVFGLCDVTFPKTTSTVTMYATPGMTGLNFTWGGACSGVAATSSCTVEFREGVELQTVGATYACIGDYRPDFYYRGKRIGPGAELLPLYGVNLQKACLVGATIAGVFTGVDFTGANLNGATLKGVFSSANFSSANLNGATLSGIFSSANFSSANLNGATLNGDLMA